MMKKTKEDIWVVRKIVSEEKQEKKCNLNLLDNVRQKVSKASESNSVKNSEMLLTIFGKTPSRL